MLNYYFKIINYFIHDAYLEPIDRYSYTVLYRFFKKKVLFFYYLFLKNK